METSVFSYEISHLQISVLAEFEFGSAEGLCRDPPNRARAPYRARTPRFHRHGVKHHLFPACIEPPTSFAVLFSRSHPPRSERGPTVVAVRYRLEAAGSLCYFALRTGARGITSTIFWGTPKKRNLNAL